MRKFMVCELAHPPEASVFSLPEWSSATLGDGS